MTIYKKIDKILREIISYFINLFVMENLTFDSYPFLKELDLSYDNAGCFYGGKWASNGPVITISSPTTNLPIARVRTSTKADYESAVACMEAGKNEWMTIPIPLRGEIVR